MRYPILTVGMIVVLAISSMASAQSKLNPPAGRPSSAVPSVVPSITPAASRSAPVPAESGQVNTARSDVRVPHPDEIKDQLKLLAEQFAAAGMIEEARVLSKIELRTNDLKLMAAYQKTLQKQISLSCRIIEVLPSAEIAQLFPNRPETGDAETTRTLSGIYEPATVDKWISEMERQGHLRVDRQSEFTILNGRTARLASGAEHFAVPSIIGVGGNPAAVNKPANELGLPGKGIVVTGCIQRDNVIKLSLVADCWRTKGETNRIQSDVELRDGQSMVLHGLRTYVTQSEVSRIPVLGDVPGVGRLFSSRTTSMVARDLMIVVTPSLINPTLERMPTVPSFEVQPAAHSRPAK